MSAETTTEQTTDLALAIAGLRGHALWAEHAAHEFHDVEHVRDIFTRRAENIRTVLSALASAREETAQAVREERRCCAQIADDEASKSDDIDAGYLSAQRIARKIRSRSHPGEKADA